MNPLPLILVAFSAWTPSDGVSVREACPGFPWPDDSLWAESVTPKVYTTPSLGTFRLNFNLARGVFGMPKMANCLQKLRRGGVDADDSITATAALVNAKNEKKRWEAREELRVFGADWGPHEDLGKDFHLAPYDLRWWQCKPYQLELGLRSAAAGRGTEVILRSLLYLPIPRPDVELLESGTTWLEFTASVLGCNSPRAELIKAEYPGSRPTDFHRPGDRFRLPGFLPGTTYNVTFTLLDGEAERVGARATTEVKTAPVPPFNLTIHNGTLLLKAERPELAISAPGIDSFVRFNNDTLSASRAMTQGIDVTLVDSVTTIKVCLVLSAAGCSDCPQVETCRQVDTRPPLLSTLVVTLAWSAGIPLVLVLVVLAVLTIRCYCMRRAATE